ncbi:hypothetical protein D0862_03225 [Hortaea werneckii]|uniref:Uncharacterized protein n=1 Tax=Hortaea werneckii TaxID=91943 RepID=A0A3M7HB03_HORWE|nr:hypothetical protein D0862_03225 [Hortaea werneckii]
MHFWPPVAIPPVRHRPSTDTCSKFTSLLVPLPRKSEIALFIHLCVGLIITSIACAAMGRTVFDSWALWQKLTFGLGCAMVATILIGCVKLGYTRWQLRKYTVLAEQEKREQSLARQMSQRRSNPYGTSKEEIPFGIRALESGIEIDGVWVSRPNTPESHSRESSATSVGMRQPNRTSSDYDVEKQQCRVIDRPPAKSTSPHARPGSSISDRTNSAEQSFIKESSRDSSPDVTIQKPPRSRHPPCSYSRYSNIPYSYRDSSALTTFEGLEAIHRASSSIHIDGGSGSSSSSQGSDDNGTIAAAAPRLYTEKARDPSPPRRPSIDLEMLNKHRQSQAAEVGQLTPRTRKASESSGVSRPGSVASLSDQSDYFARSKLTTFLPQEVVPPVVPITPKIEALPAAVRRSSMPEGVTPFSQFCQTAPPTPRPVKSRSPSRERSKERPQSQAPAALPSLPSQTVTPAPTPPEPVKIRDRPATGTQNSQKPENPPFEKRGSQVVRGHGSGFEILRPGSLNPPLPAERPPQRQRTQPPISFHNTYRSRSNSSEGRRKLQKRRRPSMDSQTSSDTDKSDRNFHSVL